MPLGGWPTPPQPILADVSSPAGWLPGLFSGGRLVQLRAVGAARAAAIMQAGPSARPAEPSARPAEPSARPAEPSAGRAAPKAELGQRPASRATAVTWWSAATWPSANRAIRAANLDGKPRGLAGGRAAGTTNDRRRIPQANSCAELGLVAQMIEKERPPLNGPGRRAHVVPGRRRWKAGMLRVQLLLARTC